VDAFEYLELRIWDGQWIDSAGREGQLHGRMWAHPQKHSAINVYDHGPLLNELGAQGWELMGFGDSMSGGTYILKRRR
jgi:hypothetical protein